MNQPPAPARRILLAAPRGFCAGVDRAVTAIEVALGQYGAPIYARHEIVHNKHVVRSLENKGAIFVEATAEVPAGSIVMFSAHGVTPASMPRPPNAGSRRSTRPARRSPRSTRRPSATPGRSTTSS